MEPIQLIQFFQSTGLISASQAVEIAGRGLRAGAISNALTGCSGWFVSCRQLNALLHGQAEFRESGRSLPSWNLLCLGLVNVVFYAVLAVPSPVQRFGFEQPNVAVLHFPFV